MRTWSTAANIFQNIFINNMEKPLSYNFSKSLIIMLNIVFTLVGRTLIQNLYFNSRRDRQKNFYVRRDYESADEKSLS